jgi:hypothetical protein
MKLIPAIVMFWLFAASTAIAQQSLILKIKEGSDQPNYKTEHLYLLEIKNTTRSNASFTIKTSNVTCEEFKRNQQIELSHSTLNKDSRRQFSNYNLRPNESFEFYVKLTRPLNAAKNSWNCTEVIALDDNGKPISNTITITSLVPDSKDQH